jgi:hypothetical protein
VATNGGGGQGQVTQDLVYQIPILNLTLLSIEAINYLFRIE